jgi:hypothetical protein
MNWLFFYCDRFGVADGGAMATDTELCIDAAVAGTGDDLDGGDGSIYAVAGHAGGPSGCGLWGTGTGSR